MRWKTLTAAVATLGLMGAQGVAQAQGDEQTVREPAERTEGGQTGAQGRAEADEPGKAQPRAWPGIGIPTFSEPRAGTSGSDEQGDSQVREVQQELKDQGLYTGEIDGIHGPLTSSAVQQFQQSQGLPVTGQMDASTLDRLGVSGSTQQGPQP